MAFGYPVLLELAGRRAVVVGAFAVEAGKVEGLLVAGAEVTVIAKGPEEALDRLERDPRVTVHRRGYRGPADLAGGVLCVASAPEPGVRDAIAADARAAGVLVNVMDDVANCDFAAPAIVRRGDLVIAIGTGGRAPALASRLRAELANRFGPEWAELVDVVGRVRTATLPHLPDFEDRSRRWKAALDLDELEQLLRAGQPDEAATRLRDRLLADPPEGCGQPRPPALPVDYPPGWGPTAGGSGGSAPTAGSGGNPPTAGSGGNPPTGGSGGRAPAGGSGGNPPGGGPGGNRPAGGAGS
jgi:siroheme synthase-like protein